MTDEERAHFEEWRKKCAESKARKRQKIIKTNVKAEAKTLPKSLTPVPAIGGLKSGPKKGKVVWRGSEQQRRDDVVLAKENRRLALITREERDSERKADSAALTIRLDSVTTPERPRKRNHAIEIILVYVFVCAITITYMLIAKAFAQLGSLV